MGRRALRAAALGAVPCCLVWAVSLHLLFAASSKATPPRTTEAMHLVWLPLLPLFGLLAAHVEGSMEGVGGSLEQLRASKYPHKKV